MTRFCVAVMAAALLVGLRSTAEAHARGVSEAGGRPIEHDHAAGGSMGLAPLFDAELQYRPGMAPVVSTEGRPGLLGSGDGHVTGPRLRGRIRWSIFEEQGSGECTTTIAGWIDTDDGVRIGIETRGFGLVPDPAQPSHWKMSAAIRFKADGKYAWLRSMLGAWDGSFDMDTGRHTYRAYSAP